MTHEKPVAIDVADAGDDNNGATDTSVAGVAIIDEDMLRGKIHEIRGQKVMLDFELAEIYGYSTTAFNQQVKNNAAKFEGEDFMFQLESNEFENLMSNKLTSSWGGRVTTITRIIDAAEYHPLFERLLEEPTIELD